MHVTSTYISNCLLTTTELRETYFLWVIIECLLLKACWVGPWRAPSGGSVLFQHVTNGLELFLFLTTQEVLASCIFPYPDPGDQPFFQGAREQYLKTRVWVLSSLLQVSLDLDRFSKES